MDAPSGTPEGPGDQVRGRARPPAWGRGPRLVVVGDALLDVDVVGTVERLCPDSPAAPVVADPVEQPRPGGAGLAAALAASDGADVVLVTAVCSDDAGRRLTELLEPRVRVLAVPAEGTTPVKRRVRVGDRTVLRLDTGAGASPADLAAPVRAGLRRALGEADAVLVSDYGRGLADLPAVRAEVAQVVDRVPVVWDPHPRGGAPLPGVRLATPNLDEAARAGGSGPVPADVAGRVALADDLAHRWSARSVAVTLGEGGAVLAYGGGAPALVPAEPVLTVDPCGAGDRFAVAAALALATGASELAAVEAGVRAAGEHVAAGGAAAFGEAWAAAAPSATVRVSAMIKKVSTSSGPDGVDAFLIDSSGGGGAAGAGAGAYGHADPVARVRAAGGTVVATGGCFDLLHAGHVATLRAARALGDALVVLVNSDASVRRLKGPGRPLVPAADRARVLEALACVDAVVVFDEDTPERALAALRPDVWAKGGDYAGVDLPEQAVLAQWGGAAVVLPYLHGRSTTQLVRTAARRARRGGAAGDHEGSEEIA